MFGYINCYDKVINGTLSPERICYTCDSFCEFSLFIFFMLISLCSINICCYKKQLKEVKENPPPYY